LIDESLFSVLGYHEFILFRLYHAKEDEPP
jgi:hypothetical protein